MTKAFSLLAVPALAAAACLTLAAPAAAQTLPTPKAMDLSGTRALAMGDAFRAVATSNEAIYFNLAGMAQNRRYEVDLQYGFNNGRDFDVYNGSIVDGTARLATGLAYTRLVGDGGEGELDGHLVHLGFGLAVGEMVALGFGFKYLNFADPEDTNAITGDLGLLIRPSPWITLGAALYNFIDVHSPEAPRSAGVGLALGHDTAFRLAGDAVFDFSRDDTTISYHAGGEYLFDGSFPLRAGFKRLSDENRNYVTAGAGFVSQRIGLDVAWVQSITKSESSDRLFSFTLKFFLT